MLGVKSSRCSTIALLPSPPFCVCFLQFAKVGVALAGPVSEEYISSGPEGVAPQAFKALVGRGHPEFSSQRQQDAQEYFSYLIDMIAKSEHAGSSRMSHPSAPSAKLFEFGIETRIECLTSHRVSYKTERTPILSLNIPLDAAVNLDEVTGYNEREQKRQKLKGEQAEEEKVLPKVPFSACLEKFGAPFEIDDYRSAYLKATTKVSDGQNQTRRPARCPLNSMGVLQAMSSTGFASFPPYLMVHLRRYYAGEDWTAKKLEVLVDMPERISLKSYRSRGPQVRSH